MKNPDYKHNNNSPKDIIKAYLDDRASKDPQFAVAYAKPNKNIDECYNYILGEAKKRGSAVCMSDDEVFGLAVHYYDEDDIKVNTKLSGQVKASTSKVTPKIELTDDEKAKARQQAIEEYKQLCLKDEMAKQISKNTPKPKASTQECFSPSLFDDL